MTGRRWLMAALALVVIYLAGGAAGPSPIDAGAACQDPTPDGGGTLRFEGVGLPEHTVTRQGDVCPGQSDTWGFSTADVPVDQHVTVQVVVDAGSVNAAVGLPDGTDVPLSPGTPYRTIQSELTNPATFQIVVVGKGSDFATYRVQACRSVLSSDCVLSDIVTRKPGDVNCDGAVDSRDAAFILWFIAGVGSLPCLNVAQANLDGYINAIDALLILQLSAGLLDALPIP